MLVYIGTQVAQDGQGIFAAHVDDATGSITSLGAVAEVERPTWVLADAQRPVLYAVSEVGNAGDRVSEVFSFSLSDSAAPSLVPLSRACSGGCGATHLALHPSGRRLFVANFGGGQVVTLPVADDGVLGELLSLQTTSGSGPHRRQAGPHAHGVTLDPSGRFLLAPDMGSDRIFVYRYWDETGALSPAEPAYAQVPSGAGPRFLLFGLDGRHAYLLTELTAEIFIFRWDGQRGRLEEVGSCALDGDETPDNRSAAAFVMSQDGRFLYASNRRTAAMQVYAIDPRTGGLSAVQTIAAGGDRPWGAELSPEGRWMVVANQGANNVRVFAVDSETGRLLAVAGGIEVPMPTSLAMVGARHITKKRQRAPDSCDAMPPELANLNSPTDPAQEPVQVELAHSKRRIEPARKLRRR